MRDEFKERLRRRLLDKEVTPFFHQNPYFGIKLSIFSLFMACFAISDAGTSTNLRAFMSSANERDTSPNTRKGKILVSLFVLALVFMPASKLFSW